MAQDHWLPGFNFNVEAWLDGDHYETLAICRSRTGPRSTDPATARPSGYEAADPFDAHQHARSRPHNS
jgi:hypothetical protein